MVKILTFTVTLLLMLLPTAEAKQKLVLELDKTEVQLGHHFEALLYGVDLENKLIDIDLGDLNDSFGVNVVETTDNSDDLRWPGQVVQIMTMKLFPRKTGKFYVPELMFEGLKSNAINISVIPGRNKLDGNEFNIITDYKISSLKPWEREQIIIEVEIKTTDKYAHLQFDALNIPGFEAYPFHEKNKKLNDNGIDYNLMNVRWILFPLISGKHIIDIPAIEYHKYGKKLRTYYFPKQSINVAPLPTYIPPTMPVGKVSISSRLQKNVFLYPDSMYYWDIHITGFGVSPNWAPPLLSQIKSTENIHFFPKSSSKDISSTQNGLHAQIKHRIPFKPLTNGVLSLPSLRVQYFDTDSGKIMDATHHSKSMFALSFAWRSVFVGLALLIIMMMAKYFYRVISLMVNRRRLRKIALVEIEKSISYADLRDSLHRLSRAEGFPENLSISEWALLWGASFGKKDAVADFSKMLSQACYGKKPSIEFSLLRNQLIALL